MKELRRLIPFLRPYRWQFAAGLILVIVSTGLSSVNPWLLSIGIDAMTKGDWQRTVWLAALAIVSVSIATGVMSYGMRNTMNRVSRRIEYDLRGVLFENLRKLYAPYYSRIR